MGGKLRKIQHEITYQRLNCGFTSKTGLLQVSVKTYSMLLHFIAFKNCYSVSYFYMSGRTHGLSGLFLKLSVHAKHPKLFITLYLLLVAPPSLSS